jgi:ribonuclease HII
MPRELLVGVDEAGRGPVVGDMVVSLAAIPRELEDLLREAGVRDSKLLEKAERRRAYEASLAAGAFIVLVYAPPWLIDEENLNSIEEECAKKALTVASRVLKKLGPAAVRVYIDEVKGRAERLADYAKKAFSYAQTSVVVEPNADAKYVATSLASIAAKVSRDASIEPLKKLFGDLGSGYPSDPETRQWIQRIYNHLQEPPPFIRASWSTLRDLAPRWYRAGKGRRRGARSLLDYVKR